MAEAWRSRGGWWEMGVGVEPRLNSLGPHTAIRKCCEFFLRTYGNPLEDFSRCATQPALFICNRAFLVEHKLQLNEIMYVKCLVVYLVHSRCLISSNYYFPVVEKNGYLLWFDLKGEVYDRLTNGAPRMSMSDLRNLYIC